MKNTLRQFGTFLCLVLGLVGCDGFNQSGVNRRDLLALSGPNSKKAFDNLVYPMIKAQCAICHTDQNPRFVPRDKDTAYGRAFELVDWLQLENSRISRRKQDKHCGVNCTDNTDIMRVLGAWAEALEKDKLTVDDNRLFTESKTLSSLPTGNTFTELDYSLDHLGTEFAGARLLVEVQNYTLNGQLVQGVYRIRKPRVATGNANIYIHSLKPRVNNTYDVSNNIWASVQGPVAANTTDPPLLSPLTMLIQGDGDGADSLVFEIGELRTVDAIACNALPLFTSTISPFMQSANKCFTCHGNASSAAYRRFPMSAFLAISQQALCNATIQRVNLGEPDASSIFNPAFGHNGHPTASGGSAIMSNADRALFRNWIDAEAAAAAD